MERAGRPPCSPSCKRTPRREQRTALRYAVCASARRARGAEEEPRTPESPSALAFKLAELPGDMVRVIVEFKLGGRRPQVARAGENNTRPPPS